MWSIDSSDGFLVPVPGYLTVHDSTGPLPVPGYLTVEDDAGYRGVMHVRYPSPGSHAREVYWPGESCTVK